MIIFCSLLLLALVTDCHCETIDQLIAKANQKPQVQRDEGEESDLTEATGFVRIELDMVLDKDRYETLRRQLTNDTDPTSGLQQIEPFTPKVTPARNAIPRNFARDALLKWPGGVIPYEFAADSYFDATELAEFESAVADFHNYTCVKFRKRNPKTDVSYLYIISGDGCYSHVGRVLKKQELSLAPGCRRVCGCSLSFKL